MSNDVNFSCAPKPGGIVELTFSRGDKPAVNVQVDATGIGELVVPMLRAAKAASEMDGFKPDQLLDQPAFGQEVVFAPSGIGLSVDADSPQKLACLVVHAGRARVAVALQEKQRAELAQALQTMNAPENRRQ